MRVSPQRSQWNGELPILGPPTSTWNCSPPAPERPTIAGAQRRPCRQPTGPATVGARPDFTRRPFAPEEEERRVCAGTEFSA